jgi:hypothetical protein
MSRRSGPGRRATLGRIALSGAVIAFLCLCATPIQAEERKHSWETTVYGGYTIFGAELQTNEAADYGLRVGWYMTPTYEWEFQYYHSFSVNVNDPSSTLLANEAVLGSTPKTDWTSTAYTARFVVNPRNDRRRFKPYAALGLGLMNWGSSPTLAKADQGDTQASIFSIGGGVHYRFGAYTLFRAEIEDLYAISEVYNNFHFNVGLAWVFGGGKPVDSDGDGVLDMKDKCPDTPKGALVDTHTGCPWDLDKDGVVEGLDQCANTPLGWPVDAKGCPLDSDGDAVPDGLDKCPDTPKAAVVDVQGCPSDSDKDGIFDGIDRCPGTPIGATVDGPDTATPGCPHDSDNDGVFDGVDQCALTPAGAAVDDKGCPKDSDGDKVLDGLDQCPDTPRGSKIDKEGCPRVRLDKNEPQILQNVKFHGMELYPGSEAWLQLLIEAANYWPDVVFEVGIYTDNEGGIATNRAAAQRRAEVVRAWLINQGIPAQRFVAKAYGPVNFVADNSTEEGRDKNRRIEVRRLSGDVRRHPKLEPEPETPPAPAPGANPPPAAPPQPGEEKPPAKPPAGDQPPPATPPAGDQPPPPPPPPPAGDQPPPAKPPAGDQPPPAQPPAGDQQPPPPPPAGDQPPPAQPPAGDPTPSKPPVKG